MIVSIQAREKFKILLVKFLKTKYLNCKKEYLLKIMQIWHGLIRNGGHIQESIKGLFNLAYLMTFSLKIIFNKKLNIYIIGSMTHLIRSQETKLKLIYPSV